MNQQQPNRRRFVRVPLSQLSEIQGAGVIWPSNEKSGVLDLSYGGAALSLPQGSSLRLSPGSQFDLQLDLSGQQNVVVSSGLVRSDAKIAAVQFASLSNEAHLAIEKFLHEKLIGVNMQLIDPEFYDKAQGFTSWYHGPGDTNIYVWQAGTNIERFVIEISGFILSWQSGQFKIGENSFDFDSPDGDYVKYVINEAADGPLDDNRIALKAIDVLSQVKDGQGALQNVVEVLKQCR
jgi:hypothetical protein